jgi:hypothetical protein
LIVITSTRFITSSNSGKQSQNSWYLKPLILVYPFGLRHYFVLLDASSQASLHQHFIVFWNLRAQPKHLIVSKVSLVTVTTAQKNVFPLNYFKAIDISFNVENHRPPCGKSYPLKLKKKKKAESPI